MSEVRSAFIRELGPVGKLIWEKALEELGFKESSMNLNQMRILLERIKKEFPEEESRRSFLSNVKKVLPDIT